MATRKLGSTKATDNVLITSVNLASEITGTLPVTNGGTGQSTFTDGQILVGNTTGNTLSKVSVSGDITLSNTGVAAVVNGAITEAKIHGAVYKDGFDIAQAWYFDSSTEGWTALNGTAVFDTANGKGLLLTDNTTASSSILSPAGLSINGNLYRRFKASITLAELPAPVGGPAQPRLLYSTGGHGISESYRKIVTWPVPMATVGDTVILDFDMETAEGAPDWQASTITQLRLFLTDTTPVGTVLRINWVAVGRNAPPVKQDTVANLTERLEALGKMAGPTPLYFNGQMFTQAVNAVAFSTLAGAAGRIELTPILFSKAIELNSIGAVVTGAIAGSEFKLLVYDSNSAGEPTTRLYEVGDLSSSTGVKNLPGGLLPLSPNKIYWLGIWFSANPTMRTIPVAGCRQLAMNAGGTALNTCIRRTVTYNAAPDSAPLDWAFTSSELASNAVYAIYITPNS